MRDHLCYVKFLNHSYQINLPIIDITAQVILKKENMGTKIHLNMATNIIRKNTVQAGSLAHTAVR